MSLLLQQPSIAAHNPTTIAVFFPNFKNTHL
jgi:hypothetical protein